MQFFQFSNLVFLPCCSFTHLQTVIEVSHARELVIFSLHLYHAGKKKRSNTRAILPHGVARDEQLRSTGRHAPSFRVHRASEKRDELAPGGAYSFLLTKEPLKASQQTQNTYLPFRGSEFSDSSPTHPHFFLHSVQNFGPFL